MFGLCDCNNFFASCERVFNPSLEGRPVVVLSNNDGCVIARSNESKAIGIKMGQPLFQIKQLIKQHNVAIYSSNYQLYGDMSTRVFDTLKQYVPAVEIYSIDEAFLDMEGVDIESLKEFGTQLAKRVKQNTGIPVSIGFAPTKTLAKVASKLCKRYPRLNGCCVMYREEDIKKVLSTYPIDDIWGIGRRYSKLLKEYGVHTAEQFRGISPEWVKAKMSVVGLRTWKELHGTPCIEFEHIHPDKQSISVSRSFAKELTELNELHQSVTTFVATAAEKLRKQGSVTGEIQLFVMTNRHRLDAPQHREGRLVKLPTATDSTLELNRYAVAALKELYRKGYGYKKAGVILQHISPKNSVQADLFDETDREKHKSLMSTIDKINNTIGRSKVTMGMEKSISGQSNRNHLSPLYTTEWADILKIKV